MTEGNGAVSHESHVELGSHLNVLPHVPLLQPT
eukprot:CAMPEP_0174751584 /NCGR_PEP_ID=MMETSP1094-20130205/100176_1 /TAXON_ID=156173 /ORGANISM="Chrysochromulina brevifilum, Strain UTEX LB 985" /LENGTH=32 /DNA_ID= /DNA_START= /DNA_END= /DNA_ORIENTATION=